MKNKPAILVSLFIAFLVVLSIAFIRLQGQYTQLAEKVQTHDYLWRSFHQISEFAFVVPEKQPYEIHLLTTDKENRKQRFRIYSGKEKDRNVIIRGMKDLSGEQYFMVETEQDRGKVKAWWGPISLRGCLPEDIPEDEYRNIQALFDSARYQRQQLTGFGDLPMYSIGERGFGFAVTNPNEKPLP